VSYLFSPPSVNDGAAYRADADIVTRKLWGHFARHNTGVTLIKNNGVYVEQQYPYHDDLVAADLYYLGGHIYVVDNDEGLALIDAGYEPTFIGGEDGVTYDAILLESGGGYLLLEDGSPILLEA
jgi:hypothetical protein